MGASGCGKTSLLNVLSGRASSKGKLKIASEVKFDNVKVDPTNIRIRREIAFVAQDDSLQATATPREAIRFSARLRLPRSTSDADIDKLVERMIVELGLSACADTIVGGPLIKGISGGERKRTSVGVELVVKPSMVFLDEPTSGKKLIAGNSRAFLTFFVLSFRTRFLQCATSLPGTTKSSKSRGKRFVYDTSTELRDFQRSRSFDLAQSRPSAIPRLCP